jgi:hypothetical protein
MYKEENMAKKQQIVPKNKGGQPKKMLDENMLVTMASEDCTVKEIASVLNCHVDTIYARYSETLRKGRDQGNCSLKRKMFEVAMSGSIPMLIWLSKQRLGYKDQQPEDAQQISFNVFTNEVPK